MRADIQEASRSGSIVANVHTRRAASGIFKKENRTAACAGYRATVRDQRGAASCRKPVENRLAAPCAIEHATSLVIVALPAVEKCVASVLKNSVWPPTPPMILVPWFKKVVLLPAVA